MTPAEDWARCRPWIVAALEHGDGSHSIADIEDGMLTGELTLWPGKRCAVITQFVDFPRFRALDYFLLGGDGSELLIMEPVINAWAMSHGCTRAMGAGRPGFVRALAPIGFRKAAVVMMKELHG